MRVLFAVLCTSLLAEPSRAEGAGPATIPPLHPGAAPAAVASPLPEGAAAPGRAPAATPATASVRPAESSSASAALLPAATRSAVTAPSPASPMEVVDFVEAIRRASQHATAANVAAEEVSRVEALLAQARSSSLPLLSANAAYNRMDGDHTAMGRFGSPAESRTGNVSLSIPLFAPSRWYQWSHASDQVRVIQAGEQDVRRAVALVAARTYLAIIAQKRAIDVSQRAVDTARAHFDFARTRRVGGVGNALDEARADQQLAASRAQLEGALNGLDRAREALGVAVGASGPVDAGGEPDLTGGPATPEQGIQAADSDRTDVRLARERAEAAHHVARDSWADWLPSVAATGQGFYQNPPSAVMPERGWQVQVGLSFPLFEGGLRVGQARERSALEAEAKTQLDGTLLQARSDVRSAYEALQHAEAGLASAKRAADSAHTALTLVQQGYKAGATNSLDVTDAERAARDADSTAVVAEDAVRQSRLDLLAAVARFP